jgi:hypothetical protein
VVFLATPGVPATKMPLQMSERPLDIGGLTLQDPQHRQLALEWGVLPAHYLPEVLQHPRDLLSPLLWIAASSTPHLGPILALAVLFVAHTVLVRDQYDLWVLNRIMRSE